MQINRKQIERERERERVASNPRKGGEMGKRKLLPRTHPKKKSLPRTSETLISRRGDSETGGGEGKRGFFACYLLTSVSPSHKGHTYIGFTVNPLRRIRQHNGEIRCGAWRTKKKRPWEMVMCIYGFPSNVSALQFEWAWQHPSKSLAVRKAAVTFKSLSGLANKIKLGYTMLTLPTWQNLHLTLNLFSTKYTMHSAGCPSLPEHMRVQVCSMDELPCHAENDLGDDYRADDADDDDLCSRTSSGSLSERSMNKEADNRRDPVERIEQTSNDESRETSSFLMSALEAVDSGDSRGAMDQLTGEELPMIRAADSDQPPIGGPVFLREVEVVDLSPSPSYRIISSRKTRKASEVHPEIDLTKSPIYV